jgi:cytoskeleton protein RodZ
MPSANPGRRSTFLYVGFSVVLLAVIGIFAYQWQRQQAVREFVAPVEPRPPRPPPAPIEQKPVENPPAVPVEAEPPAPPKPEPEAAAPAPVPAAQPGVHRLVLRMEQEAWVEVRDRDGRNLVSSLNPAGSERAVRGQPPFELVIGNAPHVTLTYNGKPVDLAPHIKGEVARLTLN